MVSIIEGMGFDWYLSFYPAIKAFLAGECPYQIQGLQFANPPWTLLFLAPLGLLPPVWGFIALGIVNLSGLFALFFKNNRGRWVLPVAISFPFLSLLVFGNIDGLCLWGLALGGPLGMILISTKPQVACLVSIVWIKKAWDRGKYIAVAKLVAPLILVAAYMLWKYPGYLRQTLVYSRRLDGVFTNGYPWLVPAGIAALFAAYKHEREEWAALASLLISPYVRIQSWVATISLFAIRYPVKGTVMALSTWIVFVILLASRSG
jgi:hypothetical protein